MQGNAIVFASTRLASDREPGESVEAWARRGRYRALRSMALEHGAGLVLLGHHQRDQAETFLLQALRGGGVAGLAAMPRSVERESLMWARPWLEKPMESIEAYAGAHGLRWIDDESNADARFARNRLRHQVWPAMAGAFPEAAQSLAAAAKWAGDAAAVNAVSAVADLTAIAGANGLTVEAWQALPMARRRNALRTWLAAETHRPVPATLVDRLCAELRAEGARAWPIGHGTLRSHHGVLRWSAVIPAAQDGDDVVLDASRPGRYVAGGWQGELVVAPVAQGGIATSLASCLELTRRRPGDRFRGQANRPARSLKLQFQAAAISAFERHGPVVRASGRIVFVPGLGIDAGAIAAPGEPQVSLAWEGPATGPRVNERPVVAG